MTPPKPKPLGTSIEVPEGALVNRPDGAEIRITGGLYVLDAPGEHVVNGTAVVVDDGAESAPSA